MTEEAVASEQRTQWHRLMALLLADFLTGSDYYVDSELDLSKMAQFLDVVVVRLTETETDVQRQWPDGLHGHLRKHNLFTFKSFQDTLTLDSLLELLSHSWNYRRLNATEKNEPLPLQECRMFALTARFPRDLALQIKLREVQEGVFDWECDAVEIRLIVLNRLPLAQQNALLLLFSSVRDQVEYAQKNYQLRTEEISTRIKDLFDVYWEGLGMKYTWDDFAREFTRRHLKDLTAADRLDGLSVEERLKGLPPEERLKGLPPEERLKGLPPEERLKGLPPEERLKGLSREELEQIRQHLLGNPPKDLP